MIVFASFSFNNPNSFIGSKILMYPFDFASSINAIQHNKYINKYLSKNKFTLRGRYNYIHAPHSPYLIFVGTLFRALCKNPYNTSAKNTPQWTTSRGERNCYVLFPNIMVFFSTCVPKYEKIMFDYVDYLIVIQRPWGCKCPKPINEEDEKSPARIYINVWLV